MPASTLLISEQDRDELESWTRSTTVSAGQRERAEIVLAIAGGAGVSGAARQVGVSRPTVIKWRERYAADGLDGLADQARSGRPKIIDDAAIIAATLEPPPASLAVTHWSSRLLGKHLGIGDATVARAWRKYLVKPWRRGTFKFSTDPELEAKVRDVVGLYLDPPRKRLSGLLHGLVTFDLCGRETVREDVDMPRPFPREFREDVIRVARDRDPETTIEQIAKDFGIHANTLTKWLHRADVEDGVRPGRTEMESVELRALKRRNRLLEQENEVLRRAAAYLSQANLPGK